MTDKKIIAVVGATGAQCGGLANAILDEPNGQFALRALMLPGFASEDIGRTAFGIFKRGTELVGRTVHISGENLSGDEYATVVSRELGEDVVHRPTSLDAVRGLPFPGAEDTANMFFFYAEYADAFAGARNPDYVRKLNPWLQDFATWLAANRDKFTGVER
jgi:hypothetical protein